MKTIDRRIERLERGCADDDSHNYILLFNPNEDATEGDWARFHEQCATAEAQNHGRVAIINFVKARKQ